MAMLRMFLPRWYISTSIADTEMYWTGSRWSAARLDASMYDTYKHANKATRTCHTPDLGTQDVVTIVEE